jgi:hypothetical protein
MLQVKHTSFRLESAQIHTSYPALVLLTAVEPVPAVVDPHGRFNRLTIISTSSFPYRYAIYSKDPKP